MKGPLSMYFSKTSLRSIGDPSMRETDQRIGLPVDLESFWASVSEVTQGTSEPHFAARPVNSLSGVFACVNARSRATVRACMAEDYTPGSLKFRPTLAN